MTATSNTPSEIPFSTQLLLTLKSLDEKLLTQYLQKPLFEYKESLENAAEEGESPDEENSLDDRFTFFNNSVYRAAVDSTDHRLEMLKLIENSAHITAGIQTICRLMRNHNERILGDDDEKPLHPETLSSLSLLSETACQMHIENISGLSALLNAEQQEKKEGAND